MSGASSSPMVQWAAGRRAAIDALLLIGLGVFMAILGPYGTIAAPTGPRTLYWLLSIGGGGVIGIAVDRLVGRWLTGFWPRLLVTAAAMTPPVTLLVAALNHRLFGLGGPPASLKLGGQVFVISLLVMGLRALTWRRPAPLVEVRTVVAPPLPEAEARFRRRLSAKRRHARLIALEAEDHYVRVHTDAGEELLTMRFAEALDELAGAHGIRVHRSWWVSADAIEAVRWNRGSGEATLVCGVVAPVSRTYGPTVKDAGWR